MKRKQTLTYWSTRRRSKRWFASKRKWSKCWIISKMPKLIIGNRVWCWDTRPHTQPNKESYCDFMIAADVIDNRICTESWRKTFTQILREQNHFCLALLTQLYAICIMFALCVRRIPLLLKLNHRHLPLTENSSCTRKTASRITINEPHQRDGSVVVLPTTSMTTGIHRPIDLQWKKIPVMNDRIIFSLISSLLYVVTMDSGLTTGNLFSRSTRVTIFAWKLPTAKGRNGIWRESRGERAAAAAASAVSCSVKVAKQLSP